MKYQKIKEHHQKLFLEDSVFKGFFNYEKIQTGIVSIDEKVFLRKVKNNFDNTYNKYGDKLARYMTSDDIFTNPEIADFYRFAQVLLHESFHVYQFFNLNSLNEYVNAIRKINEAEFKIFYNSIINGFKWNFGEKIINNRVKSFYKYTDENWLIEELEYLDEQNSPIFDDFFNHSEFTINTFEIVESQAFIFQEYATDCISKKLFDARNSSIYKKAYYYFSERINLDLNSEKSYLIFLFIANLSLKFGSSKQLNNKYSASHIFDFLCDKSEIIGEKFVELNSSNEPSLNASSWLKIYGYDLDYLSEPEAQNFYCYVEFYDYLIKLVLHFFRSRVFGLGYMQNKEYQFYNSFSLNFDRKTIAIKRVLNERYNGFDSKYFFPLMLSSKKKTCLSLAWAIHGKEVTQVEIKSVWGKENVTNEMDSYLMQNVDDFQSFLNNEEVVCCEKHRNTNRSSTLMTCNNIGSFRKRMHKMFGTRFEFKNNLNG